MSDDAPSAHQVDRRGSFRPQVTAAGTTSATEVVSSTSVAGTSSGRMDPVHPPISFTPILRRRKSDAGYAAATAFMAAAFITVSTSLDREFEALLLVTYLVVVLCSLTDQRIAVAAVLVAYTLPLLSTSFGRFPTESRLLAVPFVVVLVARAAASPRRVPGAAESRVLWLLAAMSLLSASSALWSSERLASLQAGAGLALVTITVAATSRLLTQDQISRIVWPLAAFLVLISGVMVVLEVGTISARAYGAFNNPNGLALFCVLALPVFLERRVFGVLAGALALWLTFEAASRASALALITELAYAAFILRHRLARIAGVTLAIALAVLLATTSYGQNTGRGDVTILRQDDSRIYLWKDGIEKIKERPLAGSGAGVEAVAFNGGSSYVSTAAGLGVIGIVICLSLALSLLVPDLRRRKSTIGGMVVVGGLVNATFEAWLFNGGTIYTFLFWLLAVAGLQSQGRFPPGGKDNLPDRTSYPATRTRPRRAIPNKHHPDRDPLPQGR